MNQLYFGDNLEVLRKMDSESVDLVYLDPPFNSNASYNVLFKEQDGTKASAQIKAFDDTWVWDEFAARAYEDVVEQGGELSQALMGFRHLLGSSNMMAYLSMMAPRLVELWRLLKETGSLYLHCDPVASHYLKILLDAIFEPQNFRSEIIWRRTNSHNKTSYQYGPIHDVILFYSKSDKMKFHPGKTPYSKAYIKDRFVHTDERGRYQLNYLTGPGTRSGDSGKSWKGFDPTTAGRHWAVPKSLREFLPENADELESRQKLEILYDQGLIELPKKKGGQPMYRQYVGDGVPYQDIWAYQPNTRGVLHDTDICIDEDVKYLENEEERLGFPTQKPVGLLKRIIETSTEEGDVVLDPFCGCGTTVLASQILGRSWIGIDVTHIAISLIQRRLEKICGMTIKYDVHGTPTTIEEADALRQYDAYQFQDWAISLIGANPSQKKKGADRGLDGIIYFHDDNSGKTKKLVVQVKSGKMGPTHVRDLMGVLTQDKADMGVLMTFAPATKKMKEAALAAGFYKSAESKHQRIQILSVQELLEGTAKLSCPGRAY